jgi:hypothetical protein
MMMHGTMNVKMSFPVFDRCIIYIWSWIGADPVLSLDVYVAGSSHAVVLIAASLWNDIFLPPCSFSDFQKFIKFA